MFTAAKDTSIHQLSTNTEEVKELRNDLNQTVSDHRFNPQTKNPKSNTLMKGKVLTSQTFESIIPTPWTSANSGSISTSFFFLISIPLCHTPYQILVMTLYAFLANSLLSCTEYLFAFAASMLVHVIHHVRRKIAKGRVLNDSMDKVLCSISWPRLPQECSWLARTHMLDLGSESLRGVFLTCKFTPVVDVEESRDVGLRVQFQVFVTRR
jgi:hypothetical protein